MSNDYDTGEPFKTPEEQAAFAKTLVPDPAPVPPNWGRKDQGGDAWLDGDDKPKRPANKARGALFADLLVSDDTILDALMRRSE